MSPEDDFWSRKRREEEEEERKREEERERAALKRGSAGGPGALHESRSEPSSGKKLDDLITQATPLMEQINQLYNQYATGMQARPPIEERQRLDAIMARLQNEQKATQADRFKFSTITSTYTSHRNRWDKLLMDIESGKIKRVAGARRG